MSSRTTIHTQFYFGITTVHRLILSVDVSGFNGNSKLLKKVQLSKFRKITVKLRRYTPKICWLAHIARRISRNGSCKCRNPPPPPPSLPSAQHSSNHASSTCCSNHSMLLLLPLQQKLLAICTNYNFIMAFNWFKIHNSHP